MFETLVREPSSHEGVVVGVTLVTVESRFLAPLSDAPPSALKAGAQFENDKDNRLSPTTVETAFLYLAICPHTFRIKSFLILLLYQLFMQCVAKLYFIYICNYYLFIQVLKIIYFLVHLKNLLVQGDCR